MAGYPRFKVSDIDPDLIVRLVKHIEKGSSPNGAARLEGIPTRTFRKWRQTGREQLEDAYEQNDRALALKREALMELAIEQTMAAVAQKLGKQVQNGHEEWRAKLAWLERQERDDFAPTENIDITVGGSGAPIAVEGRAVVGIGDVIQLFVDTGQQHLLGPVVAGALGGELPASRALLPGPVDGEQAAGDVPADAD